MFKEYRRHFEEQKQRMETSYRQLVSEAIHDTLHANQQKALLEEKLKSFTVSGQQQL
jgi:hypothetical protein